MSSPAVTGAGKTISVTDTTKNVGADTAGPSQTRFYLSANSSFEASDALIGSRSVPTLAVGAGSSGSTSVTIPQGTEVGTWYILGLADGEGVVDEISETNNIYARSINIGPDLDITSLSAPTMATPGQTISVSDTTKNVGGGEAGPSRTQIFLSVNGSLDSSDILAGSRSVPALAAGASSSGSTSIKIPATPATGLWYIFAKADGEGAVTETSESNNTASRSIKIGSDLSVTSVSAPAAAAAGQTISVTDTTKNAGAGDVGPSVTYIYFSANGTIEPSEVPIGTRSVPALAAGASSSGSTTITIPEGTAASTWYIIAKADGEGVLDETSETNNTYARSIKIGPDLDITTMSSPASATAGQTISVTDTTKNIGGGEAATSLTQFFLSANGSLDASDILIGSRSLPALAAGASNSGAASVTIPQGTAAGTWYIIAKADAGGAVVEISETNNTYARSIKIE